MSDCVDGITDDQIRAVVEAIIADDYYVVGTYDIGYNVAEIHTPSDGIVNMIRERIGDGGGR